MRPWPRLVRGVHPGDKRPNFLIIVADDMGWADVGCFGRNDVRTPAIDSLARDGMKFEQGYANSCVCTPSRVALATGRYQNRLPIGEEEPLTATAEQVGLEPSEPTLASQLKSGGLPDLARRQVASRVARQVQPAEERL